jgi:hypothetical protein
MMRKEPFYKRTLASFDDQIITRTSKAKDGKGWYASLDNGGTYWNDPDFTSYAVIETDAVALCAKVIREDARGIGKYAPHSLLIEGSYSFHFRLCKYLVEKEREKHNQNRKEPNPC